MERKTRRADMGSEKDNHMPDQQLKVEHRVQVLTGSSTSGTHKTTCVERERWCHTCMGEMLLEESATTSLSVVPACMAMKGVACMRSSDDLLLPLGASSCNTRMHFMHHCKVSTLAFIAAVGY